MENKDKDKGATKKKSENTEAALVAEADAAQVEVEITDTTKLPAIKRMLAALDKFLTRRIAGIGLFYLLAMIACGFGYIVGGTTSNASSGDAGGISSLQVWIYSIIATLSFVFMLVLIRVLTLKYKKTKAIQNVNE